MNVKRLALAGGGIMLSRTFDDKTLLARQVRTCVKLAFEQRAES